MQQSDAIAMVRYRLREAARRAVDEVLSECKDDLPIGCDIRVDRVTIDTVIMPPVQADRIQFSLMIEEPRPR